MTENGVIFSDGIEDTRFGGEEGMLWGLNQLIDKTLGTSRVFFLSEIRWDMN